jgi:nucleoside 2-deoxyribosyltransferase
MKRRLYFAAPLFSEAERSFNSQATAALADAFQIYLPQQDGELIVDLVREGRPETEARRLVFERDIAAIRNSDVVLIVLDGRSVDEGASFELGVAYALGKRCIGLQTDPRRLLPSGNNPMIDGALECILPNIEAVLSWATDPL